MTIKIEREALLTVLSRQPQSPPLHLETVKGVDELQLVSVPKSGDDPVYSLRDSTYCDNDGDDDDCCTVVSASTSSSSSTSSSIRTPDRKSVSFLEPLVTDVRTRPRTPKSQLSRLFYSVEETTRFRQEYRLERRLLAELDVDAETQEANEEEISSLFETSEPQGRHGISRVVILHNDKIETFCGSQPCNPFPSLASDCATAEEAASGTISPTTSTMDIFASPSAADSSDDFFDNDSFWSGSITWY